MSRTTMLTLTAAALLLAGCRRDSSTPDTVATEPGTITLTFWHIMNYEGPREILQAAVERFEADFPDTNVRIQTFENDAYKTKLAVEMASGTPPDVFFTWGGGPLAELADAGRAVDLTTALGENGWRDTFIDQALQICTVDDRVYAVPLDLSAVVLWYNRALLRQHGIAPPRTFEELLAAGETLRAADITPIALGNLKQWPGAFHFIYLAARAGGAPLFLDAAAGKPGAAFDHPAFVTAGDYLQTMVRAPLFPTGFNGIDVGPARSRFVNGDAAMYLMGTWLVAKVRTEAPEMMADLACMPFPTLAGGAGDPTTVVGGVNCGFAVSSSCRYPQRAITLLRYLTAAEVAAEWCRIGRIPALQVDEATTALLPQPTRDALDLLRRATHLQPYYDQYLSPQLATEHKNTTQKLFALTMTPEEAAAAMAACAAETP